MLLVVTDTCTIKTYSCTACIETCISLTYFHWTGSFSVGVFGEGMRSRDLYGIEIISNDNTKIM